MNFSPPTSPFTSLAVTPNALAESSVERAYFNLFESGLNFVREPDIVRDPELSRQYAADILLVSDVNQYSGAYKLRGSTNWYISHIQNGFGGRVSDGAEQLEIVTPSTGNHASANAACAAFFDSRVDYGLNATVFMPEGTPECKVNNVKTLGGENAEINIVGQNVDESNLAAQEYVAEDPDSRLLLHPFDDPLVAAGQGTLTRGVEADVFVVPVGGGGLLSGVIASQAGRHPLPEFVGVESVGAASLSLALEYGEGSELLEIDKFVDGAAVKRVGGTVLRAIASVNGNFSLETVSNQRVARAVRYLWSAGIKAETAAAESVAALDLISDQIRGKTVACLVTGGNLDQERFEADVLPRC